MFFLVLIELFFLPLVLHDRLPALINVHTIGDSHSQWTSNILELVKTNYTLTLHSMIGKTMHGITKLGINVINFEKFKIQENSVVMFIIGDIDSRNHMHKFKDSGLYRETVRLVAEYENLILSNAKLLPSAKIWIGGLVPTKYNLSVQYLGTPNERFLYNRLLNDELMRMARRNDFFYLDNYADYADENGFLNTNLNDSSVHIRPDKFTLKTKRAIANEIDRIFK
jgi:hypothetical protein